MISNRCARKSLVTNCNSIISKNYLRFLVDSNDALYKFAEACGEYYQFTLTRLMDTTIESDGVSPVQIFGLDRETMVGLLKGLATNYPEFISVTFTLDLDNINLRQDKTAADILDLF